MSSRLAAAAVLHAKNATWRGRRFFAALRRHGGLAAARWRPRRHAARPGGGAGALLLRSGSCADQAAGCELHRHAQPGGQPGVGHHAAHDRHQPRCAARWGGASQSPALRAALRLAALPRPGGQYRCLAVGAAAGGGGAVRGAWGSQPPSLCCLLFALTCWLGAQATRASLTSPGSCTSSAWASTVRPAPTRASARGGEARLFGISARPPNAACPLRRPLCPPARALRRGCTMALAPPSRQAAPARARATLAPTVPWQSQSLGG